MGEHSYIQVVGYNYPIGRWHHLVTKHKATIKKITNQGPARNFCLYFTLSFQDPRRMLDFRRDFDKQSKDQMDIPPQEYPT